MTDQGVPDWGKNPKPTSKAKKGIYTTSGNKGQNQTAKKGTPMKVPGQHG